MNIQDIETKLIPEAESMRDELRLDNIYAIIDTDFLPDPEWVLSVTAFLGNRRQKAIMLFGFIKENEYEVVLESLKKTLKQLAKNLKNPYIFQE